MTQSVPLWRIAHGRTGDKGDCSNISVIAWEPRWWPLLTEQLTEQAVRAWFGLRQPQSVRRHLLPQLQAMNFVLEGLLDGGVNQALNLDAHGKALSFHLLEMPVQVPEHLLEGLRG